MPFSSSEAISLPSVPIACPVQICCTAYFKQTVSLYNFLNIKTALNLAEATCLKKSKEIEREMKKLGITLVVLMVLVTAYPILANVTQVALVTDSSAQKQMQLIDSYKALTNYRNISSYVVGGEVIDTYVKRTEKWGITTFATIHVDTLLKGELKEQNVTVMYAGGELDGLGTACCIHYAVTDYPLPGILYLQKGDRIIAFISGDLDLYTYIPDPTATPPALGN